MSNGLEIEKKYLIAYPDINLLLRKGAREKDITQTYLSAPEGTSERVRKSVENGVAVYTHTIKTKLGGITRKEDEYVIDREEYDFLLLRADKSCLNIKKRRFVLYQGHFTYEIDVFPFWKDKAFLEIELERENQEVVLPDFVTVLADVSTDKNYTNHALAKKLKKE